MDDDDDDQYLGMEAVNYGDSNGGDDRGVLGDLCVASIESDAKDEENTDDSIESILEWLEEKGHEIYLEPQKGHGSSQMMCEEPLEYHFRRFQYLCHSHSDDELERAAVSEGLRSLSISA